MSTVKHIFVGIAVYLVVLYLAIRYPIASVDSKQQIPYTLTSPTVSRKNASHVIKNRLKYVLEDYEKSLSMKGWRILTSASNITVETLKNSPNEWPFFIRTTARFQVSPTTLYKTMSWDKFTSTQKYIDPFFERADEVYEPFKGCKIISKVYD